MNKKSIAGFVGLVAALAFATSAMAATFPANLSMGSTGQSVKDLQMVLNASADTQVAATGVGSAGNESMYFGALTKAAVMKFQAKHGISPAAGYVGPITRAVLNGMGGAVTGSYPAGCASASGFSSTTGLACVALPSATGPCTGGALFSSVTGLACTGAAAASTGEGSLAITYDPIPANNLAINRGQEKTTFVLKLKASGSDMKVSRLWLDVNTRIWLSANKISLLDGSTVLSSIALAADTITENTAGSSYTIEFNGLNLVVAKDTTKFLTVTVGRPTLTNANDSSTVQTTSTVRAVDGAGISLTYALPSTRIINLPNVAASAGVLTATLGATNPVAQSVSGLSATAGTTTDVKLMDFDLKATDGPINVTLISGTADVTSSGVEAEHMSSIELRDGSTVLASVAGATTFSFSSLNIDIASGTTKKLSIFSKVNHIASSFVIKGNGVNAVVTAVTATTGPTFTTASITPTVTGSAQYLFRFAPTLAVVTKTATQVEGASAGTKAANITFALNVTAPADSDIYINGTDGALCGGTFPVAKIGVANCASGTIGGAMTTSIVASGASSNGTGTLATWYKISAGQTRTITITGYIANGSTAGFTGLTMITNGIQWTETDNITIAGAASIEQTWGLSEFLTNTVHVSV